MLIPKIKNEEMRLVYSDNDNNLVYESRFASGDIVVKNDWRPIEKRADVTIELFGIRIRTFFNQMSLQEAADKAERFLCQIGNTCKNCNFVD